MSKETRVNDPASSERFWENRYQNASPVTSGHPSAALAQFAGALPPGRALDLGCGKGDDATWLARRGWDVLAVDVSASALDITLANARAAGLGGRVRVERHNLGLTFPEGRFDLVSAMFLESPVEGFARPAIMRRAAKAVAPQGILVAATHGSRSPWSSAPLGSSYPSPEEVLAELNLDPGSWERVFVGAPEREAAGPGGQVATLRDTVLVLQQRTQS